MKLLLDIGNTRIKWALLDDHTLSEQQALPHAGPGEKLLSDAQLSEQLFARTGHPEQVWVSNVAGADMAARVQRLVRQHWHIDAQFMTSPAQATVQAKMQSRVIRNAYREPAKLGVDRWLALLGAAQASQSALVVSVGTAMTLDAMDAQGQHLGGLIVPGPQLMMDSLLKHTSDIAARAQQGDVSAEYFADNTLGAITRGAQRACVALIADAYAKLHEHHDATLWLTGGAAPLLRAELSMPLIDAPDLVLRGLATQA